MVEPSELNVPERVKVCVPATAVSVMLERLIVTVTGVDPLLQFPVAMFEEVTE
jgi:hypothetical protein